MNISTISKFLAAFSVCMGFAQAASAQDSIAAEPPSVWIFSDRYRSSEPVVSEPERKDAHVLARPRAIRLEVCEPFTSRLLLAAYLFRDFHLEIRPLTAEHSACTVETTARVVRVAGIRQTLTHDEYDAVDQYWRELMP